MLLIKQISFRDYYNGTWIDFLNADYNGYSMNLDNLGDARTSSAWYNGVYLKNLYLYNKDFSKK